jgi:putative ABC transport system permease protein
MNLAVRDVKHNTGRFALTCLGLGMLLGVALSMIGIYRGLVEDALALTRSPGAQLWIVEQGTRGPFAESSRLAGDVREAVERIGGIAEAGSVTYQSVETRHNGRKLRLYVVGYQVGRIGGPANITAGRALTRNHYEIVVDRSTGLKLDEKIRLDRETFRVVGITSGQVSSAGDPVVFLSLEDSQDLQFKLAAGEARRQAAKGIGSTPLDSVNAIIARLYPHASLESVSRKIEKWKHLSVISQSNQEEILTKSVVERARKQIGLFTAILLVVSTVVIALIIYTMTMDKMREIATLKLIGASDFTIAGLIVQQSVIMGMIGFALGAVLVRLGKDGFPRRVILMPEDGLMFAAAVLVVCLLASALGVHAALKIEPAEALSR